MASFAPGETTWIAQLGNLRNTIRQELIGRHLDHHVPGDSSVLDVGCGQGTQGQRLMHRGCVVTGVDPSAQLLARYRHDADLAGLDPELVQGEIGQLDKLFAGRVFDAVCAHGLLMYLPSPRQAIAQLADRVAVGGVLSITFKSAHGLAMRPALRQDWARAIAAFGDASYMNELGVQATAHRLDDIEEYLHAQGFEIDSWYGVRVFNDAIGGDVPPPDAESLAEILEAEDLAGRTDPYRWLGSQLHVIARRNVTNL